MTTTDFGGWLANYEPLTDDEAFELHHTLEDGQAGATYTLEKQDERIFLRKRDGDRLLLASDHAQRAFKHRIEGYCPDPDMGWENSEAYREALARND